MIMSKYIWVAALALLVSISIPTVATASPWGASYFPNVPLTTHDGKTVHFFEDLIKDKVVAINFIYTSCPDSCPLETAHLASVQDILGDRMGKDVFFYSISIDPEVDTPARLKEYRERFGAKWMFLTGKKTDIIKLRKKLGLYVEEIQKEGSNNHNISMIIGNQKTGRWMKRAPTENPHLLADQLGNWLTGWKAKTAKGGDYSDAPKIRQITRGEQLFRTRCTSCHSIKGKDPVGALGPDLLAVTKRRDKQWLFDWLKAPDQMLKKKDPIAMKLYKRYDNLAMPNQRLSQEEATDLLTYIESETNRLMGIKTKNIAEKPKVVKSAGDVVAIMDAWVREAHPKARVNAGYMTLINTDSEDIKLVKVESKAFKTIEAHKMASVDGLMEMHHVKDLTIPANGKIQFGPGGMHLMMMGPKEHLEKGQKVDMTLTFKSGKKQIISVLVADR
jgi:copper(I)-binding protein/cytochrome oxidase Cu insertion factor (SCO1/SenC/PrrC family)